MKISMIGQKGMPARFGGVERHVHDLAVRLATKGFAVRAYSRAWYTEDTPATVDGVAQVYMPSIHTKHLDTITHTLLATIHAISSDADILHYHGVGPALWSWIPRIFSPKKRIITTFHSIDRKHQKWNWIAKAALHIGEWAACRFAHKTITVSRTLQQYARDVYDKHTTYVPNAVPLYTNIDEYKTLKQFGLEPGQYFLVVTRLIAHKGVHHVIDAYNMLTEIHPETVRNTPLVIVGDGFHTEDYVRGLHEAARKNPNIIFTGFQSGRILEELFSGARLYIHASLQEGLPITVLEAMSHSLPMILSDIPEHHELVPDATVRFAPDNPQALVAAILRVLKTPQAELEAQGAKHRTKIEREYQWDTIVPQIIDLYSRALCKQTITATPVVLS